MTLRKLAADVTAITACVTPPAFAALEDPLLAAIDVAKARRAAADEEIRLLLAYARRFIYPHPYTLGELATAAAMSVSGVRTAFSNEDIDRVSAATGLQPAPASTESS
jgi:glutathione S-transferase